MAGRRTSLASLAGAKVDDVPGKSDPLLLTLPLDKLVPTRFNPRRNFGTEEQLRDFGLVLKKRQLQPAVVVSRAGYLKLWPDEAEDVADVPYVIANGERRWRGSQAAGLTTLDVVHNEQVAASRGDFLDAVLSENNDRQDLDPIERAIGIETMVQQLGGADEVAAYYGKTKGWVSQQRKLLKLTPPLQDLVSSGDMPVREARDIAGLPAAEQAAAWAEQQRQREEARAKSRRKREVTPPPRQNTADGQPARTLSVVPSSSPPEDTPAADRELSRFTAVNQGAAGAGAGSRFTAVNQEPDPEPVDRVPDPRPEPADVPPVPPAVRELPWDDAEALADVLIERMEDADIRRLTLRLIEHNTKTREHAETSG